jgi:histidinol-phosphate aminotransferase
MRQKHISNNFVKTLQPYKLSVHKVWEDLSNMQILKLDWNESVIAPSPKVYIVLKSLFDEQTRLNWYPDTLNFELIESLARYTSLPKEYLQYFGGSDAAHEYIIRAIINPNDTIVILSPNYDNFRVHALAQGAKIVNIDVFNNDDFNIENLIKQLNEISPNLIYLSNPNNPTGSIFIQSEISQLLSNYTNGIFLIDEAYIEFSGTSSIPLIKNYSNLIITRTFSKAFGLASLRIGYIAAHPNILELINRIRNPKLISLPAQIAAIAALDDIEYMNSYVDLVNEALEYFTKGILELGLYYKPGGGNFILLKFENELNKESCLIFLEERSVYIRNLKHLQGMSTLARVTIGTKPIMEYLLSLLKDWKRSNG